MKVTTRFSVGNSAWMMYKNHAVEIVISAVTINKVGNNRITIFYNGQLKSNGGNWLDVQSIHEDQLYTSKLQLLKSL